MKFRIIGGRVVDPGHFDGLADIHVEDGKITKILRGRPMTEGSERQTSDILSTESLTQRARSSLRA